MTFLTAYLLALNDNSHRSEESSSSGSLENQSNKPLKNDFIDTVLALDEPAHIPTELPGSESSESVPLMLKTQIVHMNCLLEKGYGCCS